MFRRQSPEIRNSKDKASLLKRGAIISMIGATSFGLISCGETANATGPTPSEMSTSQQDTTGNNGNTLGSETSSVPTTLSPKEILAKLDVNSRDMVDFYPIPLDNSSPEALLFSFSYLENGITNSTDQATIDELLKDLTGHDPKTATDQNTVAYKEYADQIAKRRSGFPTYKIETVYTLESFNVDADGNTTIQATKNTSDSQNTAFPVRNATIVFTETGGETYLSPETKIIKLSDAS